MAIEQRTRPQFTDGEVVTHTQLNDVVARCVMAGYEQTQPGIYPASQLPANGQNEGELRYLLDAERLDVWTGTVWQEAAEKPETDRRTVTFFGQTPLTRITATQKGGCWTLADVHRAIDGGLL